MPPKQKGECALSQGYHTSAVGPWHSKCPSAHGIKKIPLK